MSATPTIPLRTKANTLDSSLHVVQSTLHCEKKTSLTAVYDLVSQALKFNNVDEQLNIKNSIKVYKKVLQGFFFCCIKAVNKVFDP